MTTTLRERLYAGTVPDEATGCLLRPRPAANGYSFISINGKTRLAHRVAWELDNGPIPDGLVIDHVYDRGCRHRNCINVAHLEPVTQAVNIHRMDRANGGRDHHPQAGCEIRPPIPGGAAAAAAISRALTRRPANTP